MSEYRILEPETRLMTNRELYRFNQSVQKTEACWLWLRRIDKDGYGLMNIKRSNGWNTRRAYRLIWEHVNGQVPDGLQLDHLCRVRRCVNPTHLEVVTSKENTLRGVGPSALNIRKTHCKNGHELTAENTYTWARRPHHRNCKRCHWLRQRKALDAADAKDKSRARYLWRRANDKKYSRYKGY